MANDLIEIKADKNSLIINIKNIILNEFKKKNYIMNKKKNILMIILYFKKKKVILLILIKKFLKII